MTTVLKDDIRQLMKSSHRTLYFSKEDGDDATAQSSQYSEYLKNPPRPVGEGTANATLVFLARNSDLPGVLSSMQHLEDRFNKRFGYPWVFLNEEEFDESFKTYVPFPFFGLTLPLSINVDAYSVLLVL